MKPHVRMPVVEFSRKSSPVVPEGDSVRRKGVIFRAGSYEHQKFSMTPEELKALARDFKGPILIDHGHPVVDGPLNFGRLESVEVSPDGTTLYGHTVHPSWVNTALADAKWLVSASFDRSTKAIRRLSLVTRPQISDAELQAAFACACGGDHVPADAKETPMDAWKEKALADLEALPEDERSGVLAILGGAAPEGDGDDDDDEIDEGDDDAPERGTSDFAADDPEKAELRARLHRLELDRRRERAADFARGEVAAGRVLPYEELTARDVMFQAMADDDIAEDTVDFSVGGKVTRGTREAMVRAAYGQRRPHAHAPHGRDPADFARGGYRTLDNGGDGAETPEQKRARLDGWLAKTPLGESILARRNGNARA